MKVINSPALVTKLESISLDIKYYINTFVIVNDHPADFGHKILDEEDVEELIDIRKRLKSLTRKFREQNPF